MIKGQKESSLSSPGKCLPKQEFAFRNLLLCVQSFPDCIWEKTTGKSEEKIGISEKIFEGEETEYMLCSSKNSS